MELIPDFSVRVSGRQLIEKGPFISLEPEDVHESHVRILVVDDDGICRFKVDFRRVCLEIDRDGVHIDLVGSHKYYFFIGEVVEVGVGRVEI